LAHEIEYFEGELVAWVKTDLSSTVDTILYLYYGNPEATNQENPEEVWDSNYLAVHHLEETSGTVYDSTSYDNDGEALNGVNQDVDGKINGAYLFDGSDDRIVLPQVYSDESEFTFETWVNTDDQRGYFITQRDAYKNGPFIQYYDGDNTFQMYVDGLKLSVPATTGEWHYVVGSFGAGVASLYVDDGTPVSVSTTLEWPGLNTYFGDRVALNRAFSGTMDEIRLSKIARSAAYVETSFNNQNDPDSFYDISEQQGNTTCIDNDGDGYNNTGGLCGQIDCDDSNSAVHPGATEVCDGVDNDCDAVLDGSEGLTQTCGSTDVGVCEFGSETCDDAGNWVGCSSIEPTVELCNGLDDDCDGILDGSESLSQQCGTTDVGECEYGSETCDDAGSWVGCTSIEPTPEIEDGLDNDCDGNVDEDFNPLSDWQYYKLITIDHTKVAEDLTDFPLLIKLEDPEVDARAQTDGDDILFTADDGQTKLAHEIEYFEGELVAWVKTDLSSTVDTILYLYYGNPEATNQENPEEVWDSNYLAVHHLEETSGTVYDSTSYDNDGEALNGVNQDVDGKINGAYLFDGSDDRIVLPQVYSDESEFTFETWVNTDDQRGYFITQRDAYKNGPFIQYYDGDNTFQMYVDGLKLSVPATTGEWHYVVGSFGAGVASLYVDDGTPVSVSTTLEWPGLNTYFGDRVALNRAFSGTMDEIRLSKTARSAAYVETSFNNQNDPATFYDIGNEEST